MDLQSFSRDSRRPIVFCFDLSKSMGIQNNAGIVPIDVLNDVAKKCAAVLNHYYEYRLTAEVAHISTATTDFSEMSFGRYAFGFSSFNAQPHSGDQLPVAISKSVHAINVRRMQLRAEGISCDTPMLIVFTDKNITNDDRITQLLDKYCDRSLSPETRILACFFT